MAGLWRADDGFDHWRHDRSDISPGIRLIAVYLVALGELNRALVYCTPGSLPD